MSRWKRLDRKRRALYLTLTALAVLTIATAAWASRAVPTEAKASTSPREGGSLGGQLPPPAEVLIQKTRAFPDRGNILVMVRLTEAQLAAKQREGTRSYVTLGALSQTVILRDDGKQGDAEAGDGVFTGIGMAHDADLEARAAQDREEVARGARDIPNFVGRSIIGTDKQTAFDYDAFQAGGAVRIDPAVVSLSPTPPALKVSRGPAKQVNATFPPTQFAERVLMIRDVGVVTDPNRTIDPCTGFGNPDGVWTFKHLMVEMANQTNTGIDPSLFTEEWLKHWVADQTINSFGVPKREEMQDIINQWKQASGGERLKLDLAPLRLLAIVNRVDLRSTTGGGGGYPSGSTGNFLDAGEARFIFGFVLPRGWKLVGGYDRSQAPRIHENGCLALPFSVIFEYRVPKCHCDSVVQWAQRWLDLENFVPGDPAYNKRLERLTEEFVRANSNPIRPNGSAIGQIRTNEIALKRPWELREFQLVQSPWSLLAETTTADNPDNSFNNGPVFRDWVLSQVAPNLFPMGFDQPVPAVPLFFQSNNFLGGNAQVPGPGFFWNESSLNLANLQENWGRHRASLNSCGGCHAGETDTIFVHVDPSTPGLPADLSGFLTGNSVPDPGFGSPVRNFNDLARREADIRRLVRVNCVELATADEAAALESLRKTGALPEDLFAGQPPLNHGNGLSVGLDDLKRNVVREVH